MNYQQKLDDIIQNADDGASLLLHSCCAVCSSYVLEYLSEKFSITVLYYNPNIYPETEYLKRKAEQKRLIETVAYKYPVRYLDDYYDHDYFTDIIKSFEALPEGGERCCRCFNLRLRETARQAAQGEYAFFATTLTVSPHKNAQKINEIGMALAKEYGVGWLYSDFKKKDGYLRSVRLANQYGLYRQNYCGCEFSL